MIFSDEMSPIFMAAIEAIEEAILNSLFKATSMTGKNDQSVKVLPLEKVLLILKKYNLIN